MEYKLKIFILVSIFIFIIYCNWPIRENFNFFTKIGKDIKKTANTVAKEVKKDADAIGKEVRKDADTLKRGTKKIGKFIVKEGKSLIKGVEDFSEEVWKYSESYIITAIDDINKAVGVVRGSLTPIGKTVLSIYKDISTGHIDWQWFDPCYIIAKALQKVSQMIAPLVNVVSINLAKIIIESTQIKTLTVSELQTSLNSCILSAFQMGIKGMTGGSETAAADSAADSAADVANDAANSATSDALKGQTSLKGACGDTNSSANLECSTSCDVQIPKLICDVLPKITCKDLVISSDDLYKSNFKPIKFHLCKFGNTCKGSSDIQGLIKWIQCILAPEACVISKTLGAICSITESLISGQSLKDSAKSGLDTVEGFKDTSPPSEEQQLGCYYINTFQDEVVFQCSNNQEYNLSINQVQQSDLYKNMNIKIEKYSDNTKWEIIYNQDKTVYIKNTITNNYIGYGNLTLNYDQLYENMNKNVINPMNGIYTQTKVTYTNSENLLDNSNKWVLEKQGIDSYIYVFPTLIANSYYIKNYSTGEYLSLQTIQTIENSEEIYTVICSKTPYDWTLIPDKYYQPEKYVTEVS